MANEYRVGTDCGTPAILCNGIPISLDDVVAKLNSTEAKRSDMVNTTELHPLYFIKAECGGSQYNCIILCTKSDVFDRSIEKSVFKDIKKDHNISGKLFLTACSLLGHLTIDDAKTRGLNIV